MAVRIIEDIVNTDKAKELLQNDLINKRGNTNRTTYLMCAVPNGTVIEIEYEDGFIWRFTKTSSNEYEEISHWDQQSNEDDFNYSENVNDYVIIDSIDPSVECKITVR